MERGLRRTCLPTRPYVEPFGGAMGVLLHKSPSPIEVYNDIDDRLVNLWRVVRDRPEELQTRLQLTPYSRREYLDAMAILHSDTYRNLDPIEQAAIFFICIRQSFSAVGAHRTSGWSYSVTCPSAQAWMRAIDETLPAIAARIRSLHIDNRDWSDIIDIYDTPDTCFYLDPPYHPDARHEHSLYRHEFGSSLHEQLCERIRSVKGAVVLSGYDNDLYATTLTDWHKVYRRKFITMRHDKGRERRPATEVLWINRPALISLWQ